MEKIPLLTPKTSKEFIDVEVSDLSDEDLDRKTEKQTLLLSEDGMTRTFSSSLIVHTQPKEAIELEEKKGLFSILKSSAPSSPRLARKRTSSKETSPLASFEMKTTQQQQQQQEEEGESVIREEGISKSLEAKLSRTSMFSNSFIAVGNEEEKAKSDGEEGEEEWRNLDYVIKLEKGVQLKMIGVRLNLAIAFVFSKLNIMRNKREVMVKLDLNQLELVIEKTYHLRRILYSYSDKFKKIRIPLFCIEQVIEGKNSSAFQRYGMLFDSDACFSLVYKTPSGKKMRERKRTLNLVCSSKADKDGLAAAITTLATLVKEGKLVSNEKISSVTSRNIAFWSAKFRHVDADGDGFLSREEMKQLFKLLSLSNEAGELLAHRISNVAEEDGPIDQKRFVDAMVKWKQMPLLLPVFAQFASKRERDDDAEEEEEALYSMDARQFQTFLSSHQKEAIDEDQANRLMRTVCATPLFSFLDFCSFVSSTKFNVAFSPRAPVDASFALRDYLVKSTCERGNFAKNLSHDVRCIEAELGADIRGSPTVNCEEGGTMSLANFLETIKAAVKDSTVIVCLQLGETAIAQSVQAVIAQSLREHLGALLPPLSSNVVKLSDVKGKVLLMGDLDVVVDESLRELCFLRVHPFEQRAQEGGAMTGGRMTCYNVADSSLDAHGDLVQLLCKEYFVRVFPSTALNLDPTISWARHCQAVALNSARGGKGLRLNTLVFHGSNGWRLRRDLQGETGEVQSKAVRVLQGFMLSFGAVKNTSFAYVEVELVDVLGGGALSSYRTQKVQGNCFDPDFDSPPFQFTTTRGASCLLLFSVRLDDHCVAFGGCGFLELKHGLRALPLFNRDAEMLPLESHLVIQVE